MRLLGTLLVLVLLFGCDRAGLEVGDMHPIPRVPVWLEINMDLEGRRLRDPLSYMVLEKPTLEGQYLGHKGLVVVHDSRGLYHAFDLACPYCWPTQEAVEIVEGSKWLLAAKCPKCSTVYDFSLGTAHPVELPGKYPLLSYHVSLVGGRLLVRQ